MKRIGEGEVVRWEEVREGRKGAVPSPSTAFLRAVYDVLAYLDSMTSFGPGFKAMDGKNRETYSIGYAAPLLASSVDPADLMPAAVRYLQKYTEYPKAPAKLLEFVLIIKDEREVEAMRNAKALPAESEGPPVSEETRRQVRDRLKLDDPDAW